VNVLILKEVAERLKLHPNTLRRYAKEGKLPAMKFGRAWRIEKEDLKEFMKVCLEKEARFRSLKVV